jgi:hypothetical protein
VDKEAITLNLKEARDEYDQSKKNTDEEHKLRIDELGK